MILSLLLLLPSLPPRRILRRPLDDVDVSWSLVSDDKEEEEESLGWGGGGRTTTVQPRPIMASAVVKVRRDASVVIMVMMNHDHRPELQRKPMRDGRIFEARGISQ
jgi:hypothetical protein